jgi:hypothetical protein
MARNPRFHYPGAFYQVILRGNGRQDIFFSKNDRTKFYLFLQAANRLRKRAAKDKIIRDKIGSIRKMLI